MPEDRPPLGFLTPDKGLIFRITHRENLPWILRKGLHCRNSGERDPNFKSIGNRELIGHRLSRIVPVEPAGTLGDYVPFYFTPCSPMLLNILTGYRDVAQEEAVDIVVLVARLPVLLEAGVRCVTTDRHAVLQTARFFPGLAGLEHLDWPLLQGRNFRRDPARPDRFERYQAEALIHGSLPPSLLRGVVCATEAVQVQIRALTAGESLDLPVTVQTAWYR